jgi:hypothetical protein
MKRLLALSFALMIIFAGCSMRRLESVKETPVKQNKVSTSNNENSPKDNSTYLINTQPAKGAAEKSDKLQNEAEQAAAEIDKILDSLDNIDESNLDF